MRNINMKPLQSFERILSILDCFSFEQPQLTIDEIMKKTGHPRSTAYRMLVTLEKNNLISYDPKENKYRLGHKLMEYGGIVLQNLEIRREADPILVELHNKTGQTILLAIKENDNLRYLVSFESEEFFQPQAHIGRTRVIHHSPLGIVIMAYLPFEEVENILARNPLVKRTPYTLTDKELFLQRLNKIREDGFFIDTDESFVGNTGICVPVFGLSGEVIAAITVAGQNHRILGTNQEKYLSLLKEAAQNISKRLGHVQNKGNSKSLF